MFFLPLHAGKQVFAGQTRGRRGIATVYPIHIQLKRAASPFCFPRPLSVS